MKTLTNTLIATLAVIAALGAFGCGSSSHDPVIPDESTAQNIIDIAGFTGDETGHYIMARYQVTINPANGTIEAVEDRIADAHFNISKFVKPHVKFENVFYNPIPFMPYTTFQMTITNPTQWSVYDVRAIYCEVPGSSDYLVNPDDYTAWFNYAEGQINGFKAFAKQAQNRRFGAGETYFETFNVYCPDFPDPTVMDIIVTCSFPGNCEDPYEISDQAMSGSVDPFTGAEFSVNIKCHQGIPEFVYVDTTAINGNPTYLTHQGGDKWTGTIYAPYFGASGWYTCRIVADCYYGSAQYYYGETLYDLIDIEIQ